MASAIKFFITTHDRLPELPIKNGQMIFSQDDHAFYLDFNNCRIKYGDIVIIPTEEDRKELYPLIGFYYVEDSAKIYRYDGNSWKCLIPEGAEPIHYGQNPNFFPEKGNDKHLYITDEGAYRWSEGNQKYNLIANKTVWGALAK